MAATMMYLVKGKGKKYDPKRKGRSISPKRAEAREAGKAKKGVSTKTKNRAGMGKTTKRK